MTSLKTVLAAAAALTVVVGAGSAGATVFNVDQTVGAGSVVGTITTDGATGVLAVGDITAFNLELNGPGASFNLKSPNNVYVSGADLTATATDLYFNFSGGDGGRFLLQQGPETGQTYYCDNTTAGDCVGGVSDVPVFFSDASSQFSTQSGNQIIGVAGGVPEPATWALLLMGVGMMGAGLRINRRKATMVVAA